jgi:uncharacterized membrane protein (UPF0127 family)
MFERNRVLCGKVKVCNTLGSRALGLMFSLDTSKGALLDPKKNGRHSIHMLFCFRALDVYWLDKDYRVLHYQLAKPFFPVYSAPEKARFILEIPPTDKKIQVGSRLDFSF